MSPPVSGEVRRAGALAPDVSGFKSHLLQRLTCPGPAGDGEIISLPGCRGGGVVRAPGTQPSISTWLL